ncbi:MAG: hypothetical protein COU06_01040 [Candidatus Harrisonbacteria bacterium CG10_big_fil_rev_8_21_14_0_10_38_8]|uniref:Type II toxin-antitoxin system RelE/ParE family toxin n=1 Tax=Candidatus Harrisonbacteria bacterium CG10_big_fil_rev_8_21_14_0_10_38_8 TaxID=1974582 RepID=A0A2M6WKB7_9BACT|nr:MAG: hypothetical protein COU06_01040 [Candidatus Harrisonbacteria bacterium CG10_big_fil_rev_8_21_14_0_10_38_8]
MKLYLIKHWAGEEFLKLDSNSKTRIVKKLCGLKGFSYQDLMKAEFIKKLKGQNPDKAHELKISLKDKTCRLFFLIYKENTGIVVKCFVKKSNKTPQKIIRNVYQRVREIKNLSEESLERIGLIDLEEYENH